jgi:hypothetical protein
MRLTRSRFGKWVNWVGVEHCQNVLYRVKQVYAKALALNEYTLEAKLSKTREAEAFFDSLSLDKQSDIGVMMKEVIAEEKRKKDGIVFVGAI